MKKSKVLVCLLIALVVVSVAAPAGAAAGAAGSGEQGQAGDFSWFLGPGLGQGQWPKIDRSQVVEPNPPRNPDGSFPDGRKAKIIPVNPTVIDEDKKMATPAGDPKTIKVFVNGNQVNFPDQQPYIENGRTMVPVRFVAEALGAKVDCSKDGVVSIDKGDIHIRMKIGESKAAVNGVVKTFDVRSVLTKQYRTMVPLRFVSETLGAAVNWDAKTRTVKIDLKK
ncbi:MAG: hypothetical protein PWR11_653 [Bacillota bacterium]|nr:hypothetical protein [Bacillota bacterium]